MKYRKLRIAWSAVCGILCLLLIALWVRSYWWVDNFIGPSQGAYRFGVASSDGWLTIRYRNGILDPKAFPNWKLKSTSAAAMEKVYKQMEASIKGTPGATFSRPARKFGWKDDWGFQFPYWLPVASVGVLVTVSWKLPWRFSLRTLLIGMTVVAVVLGLVIWSRGS
jgi:hypothetical protein